MGASPPTRPSASASGAIASTPLVHLLCYTAEKKLNGTIELTLAGPHLSSASILFVNGEPAKVKTSEPSPYLGGVLLELGLVSDAQLTRSLAQLASAKSAGAALHGQVLLEAGSIDAAKLEEGLREQIARKLRQIAAMPPETTFAFYRGYDGLRSWGPAMEKGFDPLPLLWAILRENRPTSHVTTALTRAARAPLRLARTADLTRLGLGHEEQAAAGVLRARPMKVAEIVKSCGLPAADAQLLLYLLLLTRQVEVDRPPTKAGASIAAPAASTRSLSPFMGMPAAGSRPPPAPGSGRYPASSPVGDSVIPAASPVGDSVIPAASPVGRGVSPAASPVGRGANAPAPGLTPQMAERWHEIVDRAASLDRMDYFTLLGVSTDATREEVETAFFALAKRWHPDRVPKELAKVRDECSRVFARMSEAHATLCNHEQRALYKKELAAGGGSKESAELVQKILGAADNFEKAGILFRRSEYDEAEALCRKATEDDPTQADYVAFLAWLMAQRPENRSPEGTEQCIEMLDRALTITDKCEKAYFWRGSLFKRLGKNHAAARDFKRAADLNPQNIDAVREVRIYSMRGADSDQPPAAPTDPGGARPKRSEASPGLFGRMFKKP